MEETRFSEHISCQRDQSHNNLDKNSKPCINTPIPFDCCCCGQKQNFRCTNIYNLCHVCLVNKKIIDAQLSQYHNVNLHWSCHK